MVILIFPRRVQTKQNFSNANVAHAKCLKGSTGLALHNSWKWIFTIHTRKHVNVIALNGTANIARNEVSIVLCAGAIRQLKLYAACCGDIHN